MALPKPKARFLDFEEMLSVETQHDTPLHKNSGGIMELEFSKMDNFPNHKFKLYSGKQYEDMVESIRLYGILLPIILWHTEDNRYVILSGHNRKECGQAAGLLKAPVIVKEDLSHEDAVLIVIETNLRQRSFSDMSESERAYCLFEHYKAMKSQGKRTDLILEIERLMNHSNHEASGTSADFSRSSGSRGELAGKYNLTEDRLAKYIRIGEFLDNPLMALFDEGQFTISVANTLSFIIDKQVQQRIADLVADDNYKIDGKKADLLRSYYEADKLSNTAMTQIMSGEKTCKPKNSKLQPIKIKPAVISKYFTPLQTPKEIEDTIDKALSLYFEQQIREEGTD